MQIKNSYNYTLLNMKGKFIPFSKFVSWIFVRLVILHQCKVYICLLKAGTNSETSSYAELTPIPSFQIYPFPPPKKKRDSRIVIFSYTPNTRLVILFDKYPLSFFAATRRVDCFNAAKEPVGKRQMTVAR